MTPTVALGLTLKPASRKGKKAGYLWATGHRGDAREERGRPDGPRSRQEGCREVWLRIWVLGQGCCGHLVGMSWSVRRPSGCKDRGGPRSNGCWREGPVLCHMGFHTELLKCPRTWHLAPPEQMRERAGERCVEAMTWPQKSHTITSAVFGWSYIPTPMPRERPTQGRE